jgi:hypothetical protein
VTSDLCGACAHMHTVTREHQPQHLTRVFLHLDRPAASTRLEGHRLVSKRTSEPEHRRQRALDGVRFGRGQCRTERERLARAFGAQRASGLLQPRLAASQLIGRVQHDTAATEPAVRPQASDNAAFLCHLKPTPMQHLAASVLRHLTLDAAVSTRDTLPPYAGQACGCASGREGVGSGGHPPEGTEGTGTGAGACAPPAGCSFSTGSYSANRSDFL